MSITALALVTASAFPAAQGNVPKSATEAVPLKAGVASPNPKLQTAKGEATTLAKVLGGKPAVVVFYRGGWCPYCNVQLAELAQNEAKVRAKGYQIIGIAPDRPAEAPATAEKNKATFTLLSDSSAEAMKAFGVAFRVDDETFGMYKNRFGLDLEAKSGATHHILPVPSVFVIDASGKIAYAYSNPDYKVRLKIDDLMKSLK